MAACWQAVKNEGNELFKVAHFADALDKYNQAIDLNPEVPTYYCNRTFRTVECARPLAPIGLGLRLGAARHGRSSSVRSAAQSAQRRPEAAVPAPAGARHPRVRRAAALPEQRLRRSQGSLHAASASRPPQPLG